MPIALLFLGVALTTASPLIDKFVLRTFRLSYKTIIRFGWPMYFVSNVILFLIVDPTWTSKSLSADLVIFILLSCATTLITGVLFYRALSKDVLTEVESVDVLQNIPTILVSAIVFSQERNVFILTLALVASVAVFWSHWDHHRLRLTKQTWHYLLSVLLLAPLEMILVREVLKSWSPVSMQVVRSGIVALVLSALFFTKDKQLPRKAFWLIFLSSALSALGWTIFFVSFKNIGVIHTILMYSLQPFFVYLFALILFKERLYPKKTIAFILTILAISLARIFTE